MIAPRSRVFAALAALLLIAAPAIAEPAGPAGPVATADGFEARLEVALLLQTLNAELLGHDSATGVLEQWCRLHRLASPARIVAERVPGVYKPPTDEQRQQLRIAKTAEVRYRRVRLACGGVVLSEADNWYVPARLTPGINRQLETTDTPFGVAVRPLRFQRHTISARLLWSVLPEDWAMRPAGASAADSGPCFPAQVLQHRAILTLPDGTPISEVVETYTSNVLNVPVLGAHRRC
jgi:chorismate-pyruvate lyase